MKLFKEFFFLISLPYHPWRSNHHAFRASGVQRYNLNSSHPSARYAHKRHILKVNNAPSIDWSSGLHTSCKIDQRHRLNPGHCSLKRWSDFVEGDLDTNIAGRAGMCRTECDRPALGSGVSGDIEGGHTILHSSWLEGKLTSATSWCHLGYWISNYKNHKT